MTLWHAALALVALTQALDAVSTQHFLGQGVREANPVLRALMERCGNCWLLAKAALALGILALLHYGIGPSLPGYALAAGLSATSLWAITTNFSK